MFLFLINSSGAIQLIYYTILIAAQIRLRRYLERAEPDALGLKMWGFPYLSYATIAWMVAILGLMAWIDETRSQLLLSLVSFAAILAAYRLRVRNGPATASVH